MWALSEYEKYKSNLMKYLSFITRLEKEKFLVLHTLSSNFKNFRFESSAILLLKQRSLYEKVFQRYTIET